jgi:hypothetical protein
VPVMRDNRTTSIIFSLSIINLSFFGPGTHGADSVRCICYDRRAGRFVTRLNNERDRAKSGYCGAALLLQ